MSRMYSAFIARVLARTPFALVALSGGCTVLSGVNHLHVDETTAQSQSATEPDAGGKADAAPTATTPDAASNGDGDAAPPATDAGAAVDSGATCGDPATAKLTSCAGDGALSSQITSCRQYCQSVGRCCSTTTCSFLGIPVAGTWSTAASTCGISPDYEMTSCDEPIRGQNPGYFRCCCY